MQQPRRVFLFCVATCKNKRSRECCCQFRQQDDAAAVCHPIGIVVCSRLFIYLFSRFKLLFFFIFEFLFALIAYVPLDPRQPPFILLPVRGIRNDGNLVSRGQQEIRKMVIQSAVSQWTCAMLFHPLVSLKRSVNNLAGPCRASVDWPFIFFLSPL